jgi:hypothetical protein
MAGSSLLPCRDQLSWTSAIKLFSYDHPSETVFTSTITQQRPEMASIVPSVAVTAEP